MEIKILQFTFSFRQLSWREETSIKYDKKDDRARVLLAHALTEVSGLKVNTPQEATKVLSALPLSAIQRMLILWRGSMASPRRFSTVGLYKAPEPGKLVRRMEEVDAQRDRVMDRVEREMEQRFGRQELQEQLELERQMARNSKMRGATRATPEDHGTGTMPPINREGSVKQGPMRPAGKKNAN